MRMQLPKPTNAANATSTAPLSTEAVGDAHPLPLLAACHDKIRQFVALTGRVAAHVASDGADTQAQEAARRVLQYFDVAAPLHHADEEDDVFPALRALGDAKLAREITALEAEHAQLEAAWAAVARWLRVIEEGRTPGFSPGELPAFMAGYPEHVAREEQQVFPALARLADTTVAEIAARMRKRRGAAE